MCIRDRAAVISALAVIAPSPANAESPRLSDAPQYRTGNGEWTYEVVPHWGSLPADTQFGGTHGAITSDRAGNLYVSTQSHTGVLVYSCLLYTSTSHSHYNQHSKHLSTPHSGERKPISLLDAGSSS